MPYCLLFYIHLMVIQLNISMLWYLELWSFTASHVKIEIPPGESEPGSVQFRARLQYIGEPQHQSKLDLSCSLNSLKVIQVVI